MHDGYGFMGFGGGWMWILWILPVIGVAVLVARLFAGERRGSGRDRTPLELLEQRYARGEIDRGEFETKKRDLSR